MTRQRLQTLAQATRGPLRYGEVQPDGSRHVYALPNDSEALTCIGRLMPALPKGGTYDQNRLSD